MGGVGNMDSARDFIPCNVRPSGSDSPRVTDNLIVFRIEMPQEVAQESLF